jgi:hypothetical protein
VFSFARRILLRPAAIKAQDELATFGLDSVQPKEPPIRAKENSRYERYELAQLQKALTETGLLMEGH